jgi:hypothetical protein
LPARRIAGPRGADAGFLGRTRPAALASRLRESPPRAGIAHADDAGHGTLDMVPFDRHVPDRAMQPSAFRASLAAPVPPPGLTAALAALWWDARGDWQRAHEAAMRDEGTDAAWVHAYLHRKEGDRSNAGYWYRRAGQPMPDGPLEAEWEAIAAALLSR